jgi:hypothetical protein
MASGGEARARPALSGPDAWPRDGLRWGLVPAAANRLHATLVCLLALSSYGVQSLAWPLFPGRDAQTYLIYYLDLWHEPVFPQIMLLRTPLAPLFYGGLLDVGGSVVAEIGSAVLYALAILAIYIAGCYWSRVVGLAAAIALSLAPAYGALFHTVSSDAPFAFGIAVWTVLICATATSPTAAKFAVNGATFFGLLMIRPSALFFLAAFAAFPFFLRGPLIEKAKSALVFATVGILLTLGWATYNSVRYGDFTVSRLSAAQVPLYRLIALDRIIRPENGPASRELVQAIQTDLLTQEPYRSYGVDLDDFLFKGRIRMWSDLAPLSDRTWGWGSAYEKLRSAAWEAIRNHPFKYAKGVLLTTKDTVSASYEPPAPRWPPPPRTILCELRCFGEGFVEVGGRRLPALPEAGDLVPIGRSYWLSSTPDNSISTDWSVLEHPKFRFSDPRTTERHKELSADLSQLMAKLPSRWGKKRVADGLNFVTRSIYPPMWLWVLIGAVGLAVARLPSSRILVYVCLLALGTVGFNALGSPPAPEYRLPIDPLFILFGVAGVAGAVEARRTARRRSSPEA